MATAEIVPLSLAEARRYVALHHRHNEPPIGHKFSIGLERDGVLVGVVVAGRPVARGADDGRTLEILRLTTEGDRNACSRLYSAACRAAFAMGYRRVITYTLADEPGSSLRASGFAHDGLTNGGEWTPAVGVWRQAEHPRMFDPPKMPTGPKVRWVRWSGRMVAGRGDEEPNDGTRSDDDPPTALIPGDPPLVGAASLDSPIRAAGMIGEGGHGMDECSCGRGPVGHTRDHVSTDRRGVVRIVREGKPDQYMDVRRVEAEALGIGREMRVREGLEVQARTPRVDPRSHRLEFGGTRPCSVCRGTGGSVLEMCPYCSGIGLR